MHACLLIPRGRPQKRVLGRPEWWDGAAEIYVDASHLEMGRLHERILLCVHEVSWEYHFVRQYRCDTEREASEQAIGNDRFRSDTSLAIVPMFLQGHELAS